MLLCRKAEARRKGVFFSPTPVGGCLVVDDAVLACAAARRVPTYDLMLRVSSARVDG